MRWPRISMGLFAIVIAVMVWRIFAPAPGLHEGDLIFQTSKSHQSSAILAATFSPYTHMGIVARRGDAWVVIEAAGPVKETPLKAWTARGRFERYAVYRRPDLTAQQTSVIIKSARALKGRPYDLFFSFDNQAIYCSELPWLAYRAAGVPVGQVQTIGALHVGNALVDRLIASRGGRDSACAGLDARQCKAVILKRELVTPASIANDRNLRQVYSNYPF